MKENKRIRKNRLKPETRQARKDSGESGSAFMDILNLMVKVTLTLAVVCTLSLGLILVHDLVVQSDYFRATTIDISGIQRLSEEEVLDTAGLRSGDNILGVNLALVKKRLMAHPWIQDASVTRMIPSRLVIAIQEHEPLALVRIGDSEEILIDVSGQPFKELDPVTDRDVRDLPRITGLELVAGDAGYGFSGPLFNTVMELLLMQGIQPIKTVVADPDLGLEIVTGGFLAQGPSSSTRNLTARLGFHGYVSKYLRGMEIDRYITETFADHGINTIDLYDPDSVTVTLHLREPVKDTTKGGA